MAAATNRPPRSAAPQPPAERPPTSPAAKRPTAGGRATGSPTTSSPPPEHPTTGGRTASNPAVNNPATSSPAVNNPAVGGLGGGVRRRADAERNIAAILDAGLELVSRDPEANVAEIARAAGVGRVTLYGHFPSREALIDAIMAHAIARANQALDAVDLDEGSAPSALTRLIGSSWPILNQHRQLMVAGTRHLGPTRMRAHHDPAMSRVERLVVRGQADGQIRTDLPRSWLVTTFYTLLHAAAGEVDAGRLEPGAAGDVVAATVLAALSPPPS